MEKFEWETEDDGYGVVGVSFVCPYCNKLNRFVCDDYDVHVCEHCSEESFPATEMWEW